MSRTKVSPVRVNLFDGDRLLTKKRNMAVPMTSPPAAVRWSFDPASGLLILNGMMGRDVSVTFF